MKNRKSVKHILAVALLGGALLAFVTNPGNETIPTDPETGMAQYKEVVDVAGIKSGELYDRGIVWINKFYVNPNGVMKKQDKEGGEIEGKARFKLMTWDKKGKQQIAGGMVSYNIALQFKDEKFRYVIDRIRWEQPSYYDVSKWGDSTQTNYDKELYTSYTDQTAQYFDSLTNEMVTFMKVGEPEKSDGW